MLALINTLQNCKLLFLDIDGVLNSHNFLRNVTGDSFDHSHKIDPSTVELVNYITDTTNCHIVISSSWRIPYAKNLSGLRGLLQKVKINAPMQGITPINNSPRGYQIQQYINSISKYKNITNFAIIDDDADMLHLTKYLVKTDPNVGLTKQNADLLIEKLR